MIKDNMKKINYNYVLLFYDVKENRVNKVFKVCKKYLTHHQNSVFRGDITPSNQIKLENEIKDIVNENEDKVTIIKLLNESSFFELQIGNRNNQDDDLII